MTYKKYRRCSVFLQQSEAICAEIMCFSSFVDKFFTRNSCYKISVISIVLLIEKLWFAGIRLLDSVLNADSFAVK